MGNKMHVFHNHTTVFLCLKLRHDSISCLSIFNVVILFLLFSLAILTGAPVGLGSTSSLGVGQQSTPSLSTVSQIDPSSIERAYAALGLPYQVNQMPTQPQVQAKNQQNQQSGQSPQGMRPMSNMSKSVSSSSWQTCKLASWISFLPFWVFWFFFF